MDKNCVIFQGTFEGIKKRAKYGGLNPSGCAPILEEVNMKIQLVLFRSRHAKYGIDEWTVLTVENGKTTRSPTWTSASMALRHFADRSKRLSEEYEADYYEGTLLPILDGIFDLELSRKLD